MEGRLLTAAEVQHLVAIRCSRISRREAALATTRWSRCTGSALVRGAKPTGVGLAGADEVLKNLTR